VTRARFEELVSRAIDRLPDAFRTEIKNVAVVVEDEPTLELLELMGLEPPDTLFGLYEGVPLPERDWAHGNTLPDRVTLFQLPMEADSGTEDDVAVAIGETLIHEFGHYFGLSEEEIEKIEERYWRGARDG
tara:strand:+ start:5202 stop:5594 length:393 start_codon:yes stop_codon:yes gene_type:complete